MKENLILNFQNRSTGETFDIEVPIKITANELIVSLNEGLHLGMNLRDATKSFLRAENPIALLKGEALLDEYGLHDGSIIWFEKE